MIYSDRLSQLFFFFFFFFSFLRSRASKQTHLHVAGSTLIQSNDVEIAFLSFFFFFFDLFKSSIVLFYHAWCTASANF